MKKLLVNLQQTLTMGSKNPLQLGVWFFDHTEDSCILMLNICMNYRKSWKVCSNGKEKISQPPSYPMTALDEYVWKKDGAYGYEIVSNEYNIVTGLQTITGTVT